MQKTPYNEEYFVEHYPDYTAGEAIHRVDQERAREIKKDLEKKERNRRARRKRQKRRHKKQQRKRNPQYNRKGEVWHAEKEKNQ